ncbi:MAG: hypothetical protein DI570_09745 [Phenylobacterium zucineum]|nr:MAG: hypothetical protein DI570_09745 [Phenylobacterium zucineum]
MAVRGDATPKIANYLVIRLLELTLRDPQAPAQRHATTIFLDLVTAFPHADVDEFRNGLAMTRSLVGWQGDRHDEMLSLLTEAIGALFRR